MSLDMLPWLLGFVIFGVILMVLIDRLMSRYGIVPADEKERSRGFADVLDRYRSWLEHRRHGDDGE